MLTLHSSRREFLQIGTAAFGGVALPTLLAAKESGYVRDKSVIVLNLQGGPTQYETFDPKMTAPREIRSITGDVKTSLPGVTFGGTFSKLAGLAKKMAVVRSYAHGISSHGPAAMHVMAGGNSTGASMPALYSRVAGLTSPVSGLPSSVLVTSRAMGDQYKELYYNSERVSQIGTLDPAFRPFDPSAGSQIVQNMKLRIEGKRLDDRRGLLKKLDDVRRNNDEQLEAAGRFQQQALDVLVRGVADAFDLSKEDPKLVEQYDTSMLEPSDGAKKRNSYAKQFSPVALGKQMILARRLCEAGCGFVTVTCAGWDMHGGGKEFTMVDGLASLTPAVDKAVAAFINDVSQRGLSSKILLVITGEFGRTPRINKNGGRDHWGNQCTLAFVGGGLKMGQVIGQSDRTGSKPASQPITSSNVLATVMNTLFDVGQLRLDTGLPQDIERIITGSSPIRELF